MHELAGIIVTPKSRPLEERMKKFCDAYGEGNKPRSFCDGWATISIDSSEVLHRFDDGDEDTEVYCPTLASYCLRPIFNPHTEHVPFPTEKYYTAEISTLVTPSDKVYFDDEAIEKLAEYREKHPDWGIIIINYHH